MADLETLARTAPPAEFLAAVRTRVNARSLIAGDEVALPAEVLRRLLTLADTSPPKQIGVRGYLRAAGIDDASGEYVAHIAFADQEAARAAGALIFADVMLEPVMESPPAANEEPRNAAQ